MINIDNKTYKSIIKQLEDLMITCHRNEKVVKGLLPIYKCLVLADLPMVDMQSLPYNLDLPLEDCKHYASLVRSEHKIPAIKELRTKTGIGLKEAKEIVEYITDHF